MASLNLNKVILAGHLAETPELRQTTGANPVSVCKVRLIVNRPKKQDGTPGGMDGFDVLAWRGTAEFVCRYFKKGQAMCVTGKLQNRSYQDRNGETRWVTEVIADEVSFVDSANSRQNPPAAPQNTAGASNSNQANGNAQKAQPSHNAPQTAQMQGFQPYDAAQDDDLPF